MSAPKERFPPKYPGAAIRNWRNERGPAVTRRDTGEARVCIDDLPHDTQDVFELASEVLFLALFAAIKRNAVNVFIDVHEREAQFGFLRICLETLRRQN
jgi:hypothetical protein